MFVLRLMQWTESQAVHCRNRPGAHGENIPEDSADTGCGALERLDKRWMVMGLDLESNGEPVADIDDSRILARTLKHRWPLRRQPAQMHARALVAAVLAPHHAENTELRQVGLAFKDIDDLFVFGLGQAVLGEDFVCDHYARTNAFTIDSKMSFPSALPKISSLDRSG